ncbi:MAG: hypothetical protein ABI700_23680 [Chloroflexota bacterium]
MNDLPHDPNSLADELDRVLPPGQTGQAAPSSNPLVEAATRLSAAPRPALSPEALARIHATMQAAQTVPLSPSKSLIQRFLRQSAPVRLAVAAVLLFVFVSGAIFAAKISVQLLNPPTAEITSLPPSATALPATASSLPPSATPLPPSATPIPPSPTATIMNTETSTSVPPSPTVTPIATELPLLIPTTQPTRQPTTPVPSVVPTTAAPTITTSPTLATATFTPTVTAAPTLPVTIVVEGPIQSINGNTIIIFDFTIVLSDADLALVHVGDIVRVEGHYMADSQVIIAIHVTVLRNTPVPSGSIETNPSTGEVWTDSGNCSNPPPPWATANGWRRRCEGAANPGNSGDNGNGNDQGNGNGNGNGMGNGMGG